MIAVGRCGSVTVAVIWVSLSKDAAGDGYPDRDEDQAADQFASLA